jgi:hypothetical protein
MKKTIALLALSLLTTPLIAQVTIKRVNDRRTSGKFFNELAIELDLPKVKASDVAASRVLVTSATDNTGKSLVDPEKQEPRLDATYASTMADDDAPAHVSLSLLNPERKATSVKEVRGEIELFMPSKDPNSVASIAKFLSFSGKPLSHKALKANGVEISLLSPAQIEAEKKKIGDAKRKEYAGMGYEGESLESAVNSSLEYTLRLDEGDLLLRIKDPNKRIQEISYMTGTEAKRVSTNEEENGAFVKFSLWGEKVQPDWGLRISMKTPKNTVRQAFSLKDIPLP